ncbi:hypothetical protein KGF42_16445 [Clostridioides sp. ZZV15-6383]|uniref:hypothetical protein n=1 Tax=Clostridioides sp. ZZV15-6383 TaxID=2811498 RepID=UPI001D1184D3|nr:hypothetical protein [Clostridioides sp. ZZV15-6383]
MNSWSIIFLSYGITFTIGIAIRYLIKRKANYCNKKYLDKLELKYGNIDREKAVKLEIFYDCLIGLEYIIMGLLIRKTDIAIISIVLVSTITIVSHYLIMKRYIVL